MPKIFDVTANENACYKHNELELKFFGFCTNKFNGGKTQFRIKSKGFSPELKIIV